MSDTPQSSSSRPTGALEAALFLSPWIFIPTLYFAQGLPGTMIQQMTPILLKDLGIENKDLALFTALISWPWVLKMFWGAMVDRTSTKRQWIAVSQVVITGMIFLAAFSMVFPFWIGLLLAAFFVLAFMSATHDIAADGFYLLSVKEKNQEFFIGIRSTFFRLSAIFTTTGLVALAGALKNNGVPGQTRWAIAIGTGALVYGLIMLWNRWRLPKPVADTEHEPLEVRTLLVRFVQIVLMLAALILAWRLGYWTLGPLVSPLFGYRFDDLVAKFGTPLFFEKLDPANPMYGYGVLSREVQLMISLAVIAVGGFFGWSMWTKTGMQEPAKIFFDQKRIFVVLGFILFFRFGEIMIGTLGAPFLQDTREKGGLAVPLEMVGFINGTVGIIALTLGGILGGITIAKFGIKKCLWPMVLALNIPNLFYVYAAVNKIPIDQVYGLIAVDQFGYGFGFSAYMVYLLFICRGKKMETSVYAIATGLMLLGANVARLVSGFVWDVVKSNNPDATSHYTTFFIVVLFCTIPGMLVLPFLPMQGEDIKRAQVDID